MKGDTLTAKQLRLWIFAGVVPVGIQLGGDGWLWVAAMIPACGLLEWICWRWDGGGGKWSAAAQYGVTVCVLSRLLSKAAGSWPGSEHVALPLILLALAVRSAGKGLKSSGAVGCVLYWFVAIGYGALLLSGAKDGLLQWKMPEGIHPLPDVTLVLLVPVMASILRRPQDGWSGKLILTSLVVLAGVALAWSVLGGRGGFYEMCRCLEVLGVAKRFEAVVSTLMTVGWFSMLSLCLSVCGKNAEKIRSGTRKRGVYGAAMLSAVLMVCKVHINPMWVALAVPIFWVLGPVLEQAVGAQKKS